MMRAELGRRTTVALGVLARRMGARCPRLAAAVTVERLANRLTLIGSDGLGISFNGALAEDVPASIPATPSTAGA